MPYNFVTDIFHTKNFVAYFLQAKCDFTSPPFGGLGATYDVHLRLIGKHVVDFLLLLIELVLLGATTEALRIWGEFEPKFQVEGVALPTILLVTK